MKARKTSVIEVEIVTEETLAKVQIIACKNSRREVKIGDYFVPKDKYVISKSYFEEHYNVLNEPEYKARVIELTEKTKINTIQNRGLLNKIDNLNNGEYLISRNGLQDNEPLLDMRVQMQYGHRNDKNSKHGAVDGDLLEIIRDRYKNDFCENYPTDDNKKVLELVEETLELLNKRAVDRLERGVLGTYKK